MKTFKTILATFAFMLSSTTINAQVFQEWVQRFNGPDSLFDQAVAIGVDGCIYVTGASTSIASRRDYVTIKYDKQGNQKWAAVFNGSANGDDIPTAIAIDKQCNVYITGFTDINAHSDFATIKYDSSGVQQWIALRGSSNSLGGGTDITTDELGNVYVTGTTNEIGKTKDVTIKYNVAGVQQWVAQGNDQGGIALALDGTGNVYIAAGTHTTPTSSGRSIFDDIVTAKYNASGVQQWRVRFNGTANKVDQPTGLAVDAQGNVFVTGFTNGFINADFATIRYNTNGVQQWVQQFNGALNGNDEAAAIVLDSKGNVTVTGKSSISTGSPINDFTTIQYTKNGKLRWANIFNGPGNFDDFATAIATDKSDNIYITGASAGSGSRLDYATIKYAPNGELQWTQRFNGATNGADRPNDIAVDNEGNAYVTGLSFGGAANFDFATVKYSQEIRRTNERTMICYNPTSNPDDEVCFLHPGDLNCGQLLADNPCECLTFCLSNIRMMNRNDIDTLLSTSSAIKNEIIQNASKIKPSSTAIILTLISTIHQQVDSLIKADSAMVLAGIRMNPREILNILNKTGNYVNHAANKISDAVSITEKITENKEQSKNINQSHVNNLIKKLNDTKMSVDNAMIEAGKIEIHHFITIKNILVNNEIHTIAFDAATNQEILLFITNK